MLIVFGIVVLASAVLLLYLKYRVVLGVINVKPQLLTLLVVMVVMSLVVCKLEKKHLSLKLTIVNIIQHMVVYSKNWANRKLEKKSLFVKKDKYGNEVFKMHDYRIEIVSLILVIFSIFLIRYSL